MCVKSKLITFKTREVLSVVFLCSVIFEFCHNKRMEDFVRYLKIKNRIRRLQKPGCSIL